jgi:hypothetical protein
MGIDSIYNTTVAKIEAGDREIKLDEAVAMADLFELDLNDLRRHKRDLDYLLDALSDTVFLSRTELDRTARLLRDRMEDIPADYERHDALAGLVGNVVSHLDAAGIALDELVEHFAQHIEQSVRGQVLGERMAKRSKKQAKA